MVRSLFSDGDADTHSHTLILEVRAELETEERFGFFRTISFAVLTRARLAFSGFFSELPLGKSTATAASVPPTLSIFNCFD